jgi:hypothetical protein
MLEWGSQTARGWDGGGHELVDILDLERSFEAQHYKGLSVGSLSHRKTKPGNLLVFL